jgi:hypothetical protein
VLPIEPAKVDEAVRFSTNRFTSGGIAYDGTSRRFLFGDVTGRRLFVVGEGSDRAVDLVRADSAGFEDVRAIAVDSKRGDLWVASSAADGTGGAIHRLQLISGRTRAKIAVPGQGPTHLGDLTVSGDGTVFVLDSGTRRLLVLRAGASTVDLLMPLTADQPASIAVDDSGRWVYLAHAEGIARIDARARRASPLMAANGIALTGFESIRLHRDTLVGSQAQPDGSRALVRLQLDRDRRGVMAAARIDTPAMSAGEQTAVTISGDDLYYLVAPRMDSPGSMAGPVNVHLRRVTLPSRVRATSRVSP